ncbi:trypsin-like serine peptidase [Actinoplanes sp. URMC 104]|uniref:trypsin-like serine peptidase n=1 Tax=Actinoplanes sp. URMC 104 TaxID=3423409 RepID=UPI003F19C87D
MSSSYDFNPAPPFIGRVVSIDGESHGTCFQVAPGVFITAYHVTEQARLANPDGEVFIVPLERSDGAFPQAASVERVAPEDDLAVLASDLTLDETVPLVAMSADQLPGTNVHFVGAAILDEGLSQRHFDVLATNGSWEGPARQLDGTVRQRVKADGVEPGMSGCPVLRVDDGAVVGVLSGRYNSDDGWSAGRVWLTSAESLLQILRGFADLPVDRRAKGLASPNNFLNETLIDRNRVKSNPVIVVPSAWQDPWSTTKDAVLRGEIPVIAATAGVGATTFAEKILAEATPEFVTLVRLDPSDWNEPQIGAMAFKARHAYILDLRDPEHDRPSLAFLEGLSRLTERLSSLQSYLVVTVREQIWRGLEVRQIPKLTTVRLTASPDPVEIVHHYLEVRNPEILSSLGAFDFRKYVGGMNVVQAVEAVEVITATFLKASTGRNQPGFVAALTEVLDDHAEELDDLFADSHTAVTQDGSGAKSAPLSLPDRCLMLSLALRRSSTIGQIETDARSLEAVLSGSSQANLAGRQSAALTLAGAGLRGRLKRIKASPTRGEAVVFDRSSMPDAVVFYVWDNYEPVRAALADWLVGAVGEGRMAQETAVAWLTELIRRNESIDFVRTDLAKASKSRQQTQVLAAVLAELILNQHLRRRCERVLYDWSVRLDFQEVVIDVSARILRSDRSVIGLRRLQRVSDYPKTAATSLSKVQDVFAGAFGEDLIREKVLPALISWFREAPTMKSSRMAFAALLTVRVGSIPWIFSAEAHGFDLNVMLSEVIYDASLAEPLVNLLQEVGDDPLMYARAVDSLASAAAFTGSISVLMRLADRIRRLDDVPSRDVLRDLSARMKLSHVGNLDGEGAPAV